MTTIPAKDKDARKRSEAFYDAVAHPFSNTRGYFWDDLRFIKEYHKKGDMVLDFGCGNGRLIDLLQIDAAHYIGADISEKLLAIAKEKYAGYRFAKIGDEQAIPLESDSVDVCFSIAVVHHMTPSLFETALREMYRVLRRDGTIVVTGWDLWTKKRFPFLIKSIIAGNRSLLADLPFHAGGKTHYRPCYWWTMRRLIVHMRKEGFEVVRSGQTKGKKGEKRNMYIVAQKKG
jgi:ubiquinone/menaquinone biosynthesis C-methylase UbiE